jgi:hypothetical protein
MNRNNSLKVIAILCGISGMCTCLSGTLVFLFGAMAETAQLKLDTNLDRSSVIIAGIIAMLVGLILIGIPFFLWMKATPNKTS